MASFNIAIKSAYYTYQASQVFPPSVPVTRTILYGLVAAQYVFYVSFLKKVYDTLLCHSLQKISFLSIGGFSLNRNKDKTLKLRSGKTSWKIYIKAKKNWEPILKFQYELKDHLTPNHNLKVEELLN